jgi:N-dimethylarginine dimethylaminohydrolase
LNNDTIYVGVSERTNKKGVQFIQDNFQEYTVVPVTLENGILHLDVVFNCLSDDCCIIYSDGILKPNFSYFKENFVNLIAVSSDEQFDLATNVFALGYDKLIVDSRNRRVNDELDSKGYRLIELDFRETSKIGGAFRCATMPLRREVVKT